MYVDRLQELLADYLAENGLDFDDADFLLFYDSVSWAMSNAMWKIAESSGILGDENGNMTYMQHRIEEDTDE